MDTEIDILLAKQAILDQLHSYSRAVDRLDAELFTSVWHSDGTLEFEGGALKGNAHELVGTFMAFHDSLLAHVHQVSNVSIEVVGDRAASESYAFAMLQVPATETEPIVSQHFRGRYLDRWSRREGRWRIDHRQVVREMFWSEPAPDSGRGAIARRGPEDPVYELFASLHRG